MRLLEIAGLVSFISFIVGMVALIVTYCLLLGDTRSKALHKLLKVSIWIYGVFGLSTILISIINELIV
jgi:uncharacterized membrane protein YdcZ (DUF606 family)